MLDVAPLFPDSRKQMREVFGIVPPVWEATPDIVMTDRPVDRALVAELVTLDRFARAVLLQLRNYRYKPGWSFTLVAQGRADDYFRSHDSPFKIQISARVPDSRWHPGPGETEKDRPTVSVTLRHEVWPYFFLPTDQNPEENLRMFRAMLRGMIQSMEDHELDEWFAENGQLVDDPHARKVPSKIGPIHR